MLNNYLVRSRLIVLALLPVVIFTITAIYSISTMGGLVKGIDSLYENRVVPLKQIKTVSDNYAVNIVDLFHKFKAGTISQNDLLAAVQQSRVIVKSGVLAHLDALFDLELFFRRL